MDSTDFLVILLSIGMSIVLLLTIISLFYVVKILKHLKTISERAEKIADNVDSVSSFFKKSAGPVAISKLIANLIENMRNREEKKGK